MSQITDDMDTLRELMTYADDERTDGYFSDAVLIALAVREHARVVGDALERLTEVLEKAAP